MDSQLTQPLTQQTLDPRRLGRNNSGLKDSDISDVLCILHPASIAAYRIVQEAAVNTPEHVLQNEGLTTFENVESGLDLEEQETIIIDGEKKSTAGNDLALRMSSITKQNYGGFLFGRNGAMCDIVFSKDSAKRTSNKHFRIFVNTNSMLMLEDTSTNGTVVDDILLKCKDPRHHPTQRVLDQGSIVCIQSTLDKDLVKFVVRFPSREGHEEAYDQKFRTYVNRCAIEEARTKGKPIPTHLTTKHFKASGQGRTTFGMYWNGGEKYNVVGLLGKGAFATVYQLATKNEGHAIAAKELEKKAIMKNGQMDQKIDNEMRIMKELRHPNVVQYIDFHDFGSHLYIMMELIEYGDLSGYIERHGRLSEEKAKTMARQVLSALAYLHQKNITHRDIKPDNILIKSENPLTVAIADFGLAKLVKNNETFLKTFCGTLLWCAPEIYPYYREWLSAQGRKRSRGSSKKSHNEYSQSVDIWSFAGVLWSSLCGSPPFVGTAVGGGSAMFNVIMNTRLDGAPLREVGVSEECIDLLLQMLNTDPNARLTDVECLRHPWLADGTEKAEFGLGDIQEEEEDPAQDLSQLSISEQRQAESGDEDAEADLEDDIAEYFEGRRPSKRVRPDGIFPSNQIRDGNLEDSSLNEADSLYEKLEQPHEESFMPPGQIGRNRLFGEISQRALQSSGLLGTQAHAALSIPQSARDGSTRRSSPRLRVPPQLDGGVSSPSLLGAESMVRDLNMTSPQSPNSRAGTSSEPTTPTTPNVPQHSSLELGDSVSEATPKAKVYDRRIRNIQKPPSFYYDPSDLGTHNLEYASRVSGFDYVAQAEAAAMESKIPDTMVFPSHDSQAENNQDDNSSVSVPALSSDSGFLRPLPRLGKLTATTDSFSQIVLKLDKSNNSWGRNLDNTIVYANKGDSRVPKKAFEIYFHAEGHEDSRKLEAKGIDWTKLNGLYTGITTWSSIGVSVNGVHLKRDDGKGRVLFGKLYTGDVITVFDYPGGKLKFVCDFFVGSGKQKRAADQPFKIERGSLVPQLASLGSAQSLTS
ncbi:Pkinase-domain-containing protein [Mytilinidion resinicola]|uniref:Autophagy-related protein 1 n=1 Tax=Mytilinidion resinicola TaxID=574789 RepID=A0A6A6YDH1_9PEZI|nr:Pkinase-domain-containing protein [Mytilinidion resinicola]KAF2806044.1 Pkinase-domain-containing protein [Mytilinidion resinicola]